MEWVLEQLMKVSNSKYTLKYREHNRGNICYHNPEEIIHVSKELVDYICKDEQMLVLLKELGPEGFNEWFRETFGEPEPYITYGRSMGRFKSKREEIKEELINENAINITKSK